MLGSLMNTVDPSARAIDCPGTGRSWNHGSDAYDTQKGSNGKQEVMFTASHSLRR